LVAGHDSDRFDYLRTDGKYYPPKFSIKRSDIEISNISEVGPVDGLVAYWPFDGTPNGRFIFPTQ